MAWARPAGAWAAAVEEEEAESGPIAVPTARPAREFPSLGAATKVTRDFPSLGDAKKEDSSFPSLGAAPKKGGSNDFPSLGGAAAAPKESKTSRKKKGMTLADFQAKVETSSARPGTFVPSARSGLSGLGRGPMTDDEILLSLPTSSRGKVDGEEPSGPRLGGAFAGDERRSRFGDDDRRPRRDDEEDAGPSRADAVDSWGVERKFVPSGGRGGGFGGERRGGFGDGERRGFGSGGFGDRSRSPQGGPARADTVDSWGAERKFVPSGPPSGPRGRSGFFERGDGPEEREGPSRADAEDKWSRGGGFKPGSGYEDAPRRGFEDAPRRGFEDASRRGFEDAPRRGFGGGFRSRSGSRASHSPEGRDTWRRGPSPSGPAPKVEAPEVATRGASRASVFGAARPREEVLAEQQKRVDELQARADAGEGEQPAEGEDGPTVAAALEEATAKLARLSVRPAARAEAPARAEEGAAEAKPDPAAPSKADQKDSWRKAEGEEKPRSWVGHYKDARREEDRAGDGEKREGEDEQREGEDEKREGEDKRDGDRRDFRERREPRDSRDSRDFRDSREPRGDAREGRSSSFWGASARRDEGRAAGGW